MRWTCTDWCIWKMMISPNWFFNHVACQLPKLSARGPKLEFTFKFNCNETKSDRRARINVCGREWVCPIDFSLTKHVWLQLVPLGAKVQLAAPEDQPDTFLMTRRRPSDCLRFITSVYSLAALRLWEEHLKANRRWICHPILGPRV